MENQLKKRQRSNKKILQLALSNTIFANKGNPPTNKTVVTVTHKTVTIVQKKKQFSNKKRTVFYNRNALLAGVE